MLRTDVATQTESTGRLGAMYCVAIVFVFALISHPCVEMGVDDDFSYILTARAFAQTGHFVYNGWAATMLGWQIPLGALFIRLFGFSFTVPRASTVLVALLTTYLLERTLERCGVHGWNACIGTLMLMLTPIFFPLIPTFMSDVPGFFAILVCLYCCLRALQTQRQRAALAWLCLAGGSNLCLGTVRQIAWLGVLVMVPCTAWLLRKRRWALLLGAGLWFAGALSILGCMHWFAAHRYSVPEKIFDGPVHAAMLHNATLLLVKSIATLGFLAQPILLAFMFASARKKAGRPSLAFSAFMAVIAGSLIAALEIFRKGHPDQLLFPWLGQVISTGGALAEFTMPGTPPTVLPFSLRVFVTILTAATGCYWLSFSYLNRHAEHSRDTVRKADVFTNQLNLLLVPFALAYVCLLVPRAVYNVILDRYLIAPLFVLTIYLLRHFQQTAAKKLPWMAPAVVLMLAFFSVSGTHDLFATNRARLHAANELQRAGIPRKNIEAGFEYDGWTQIEASGHLNEAKIVNPPGSFQTPRHDPCGYWFSIFTPAISPRYVLSYDTSCGTASLPPVSYRAWLPPHMRKIYIQQVQ